MAFQPVLHVAELVVRGVTDGNERVNTFYYKIENYPPSAADLLALGLAFRDVCLPKFLACTSFNYAAQVIDVRDLTTNAGLTAHLALVGPYPGQRPANRMASNVAIAITRHTAFIGRRNRGWIDIPDIALGDVTKDIISGTIITALSQLCTVLLQKLVSNTFTPVVASRTAGFGNVVHDWTYDTISDSQNRRIIGHGD